MYIGSGLVTLMCQVVLLVGIKKRKSQSRNGYMGNGSYLVHICFNAL